ncbi:hypothetical protein [Bacillus sp. AFS040349]|uniref:hypothetical protein n=1 Tax=Bacillus sp. AFS040349 TaxID=2033502 RepID=UPI000BFD2619|nr:hypothetical protein [Bacillus sp. AFS040349]PGT79600.1 hypothetical protein COD11_22445 [Bacillus sp. AFS040349]
MRKVGWTSLFFTLLILTSCSNSQETKIIDMGDEISQEGNDVPDNQILLTNSPYELGKEIEVKNQQENDE